MSNDKCQIEVTDMNAKDARDMFGRKYLWVRHNDSAQRLCDAVEVPQQQLIELGDNAKRASCVDPTVFPSATSVCYLDVRIVSTGEVVRVPVDELKPIEEQAT